MNLHQIQLLLNIRVKDLLNRYIMFDRMVLKIVLLIQKSKGVYI